VIHDRTLSDFVAATSINIPNTKTTRKACHITGEESPQPLIMIDRKASDAHVVGNTILISLRMIGRASTGQSIPDNNKTGNNIGITNCMA